MDAEQAIVDILEQINTDTVFTLMSEDTMGLLTKIYENSDIELVQTRHEQGAVAMADGYSRISNQIGVCVIGRGPAIAQTGASLVTSSKSGSKLLVLVPEPRLSTEYDGKDFAQESYLSATVGEVVSIRHQNNIVPKLEESIRKILTGQGPISVQIAQDILSSEKDIKTQPNIHNISEVTDEINRAHPSPKEKSLNKAFAILREAKTPPAILVGKGAVKADAKQEIIDLAEYLNSYIFTTLQARDYFGNYPYSVGFVGGYGTDYANKQFQNSSEIIAIGCSLNPFTTCFGDLINNTDIIHIDIDKYKIGQFTPVEVGLVGDAQNVVQKLVAKFTDNEISESENTRKELAKDGSLKWKHSFDDFNFKTEDGSIDPRELVYLLDKALPENRVIVTDLGHSACWVYDGITLSHPDDYVWTGDFGAIGQGLGMAIGAARASQDKICVAFCGDAGFMMSAQELETAVRSDIPLIVIVMNDGALGAEYHRLTNSSFDSEAAVIETSDIGDLAMALGAESRSIRTKSDLDKINEDLFTGMDKPFLLDCKINRGVKHRSRDRTYH